MSAMYIVMYLDSMRTHTYIREIEERLRREDVTRGRCTEGGM